MTTTNRLTQTTDPTLKRSQPEFKLYEPVDIRGVWLGQEKGYQWHSGCYILHQEFRQGQWWYAIARPYQGNHNITQLSYPLAYTSERLRKTENSTPLKVTGGVYKSDEFLPHYGGALLRNALQNGLIYVE
ncbi:MAG TPA: hypothetical protein DCY91_13975 [Cyanobacteria bacterium UBA11370]|nr:hypothetical protein [Cyanobacteria bacterium UBA11370]